MTCADVHRLGATVAARPGRRTRARLGAQQGRADGSGRGLGAAGAAGGRPPAPVVAPAMPDGRASPANVPWPPHAHASSHRILSCCYVSFTRVPPNQAARRSARTPRAPAAAPPRPQNVYHAWPLGPVPLDPGTCIATYNHQPHHNFQPQTNNKNAQPPTVNPTYPNQPNQQRKRRRYKRRNQQRRIFVPVRQSCRAVRGARRGRGLPRCTGGTGRAPALGRSGSSGPAAALRRHRVGSQQGAERGSGVVSLVCDGCVWQFTAPAPRGPGALARGSVAARGRGEVPPDELSFFFRTAAWAAHRAAHSSRSTHRRTAAARPTAANAAYPWPFKAANRC